MFHDFFGVNLKEREKQKICTKEESRSDETADQTLPNFSSKISFAGAHTSLVSMKEQL